MLNLSFHARVLRIVGGAVLLLSLLPPVLAHRLNVFATVEGNKIAGYVYVSGGGRAREARITVLGPDGKELQKLRTNARGEFAFTVKQRVDYTIVAETGDGHRASYTVKATELPAVGAGEGAEPAPAKVETAVVRQIQALREELRRHEERVRLRDILGGIGYIFGVMGLILYFKSRKQAKS